MLQQNFASYEKHACSPLNLTAAHSITFHIIHLICIISNLLICWFSWILSFIATESHGSVCVRQYSLLTHYAPIDQMKIIENLSFSWTPCYFILDAIEKL